MVSFFTNWSARAGTLALSVVLGGLVVACATVKPANLKNAEVAVEQAQSIPEINQYAPVKRDEAKEALQRAQAAWKKGESEKQVEHLAYLAQQRAAIAEATAAQKGAQAQIKTLNQERQQILMKSHKLEAKQAREQAKQAESQAQKLKQELGELKAKETKRGYVVTLGNILFKVDSAELSSDGMQSLFRLVTFLKDFPEREVVVEGYTDSTGSGVYNLKLSQQRADSVRSFLINNGISPDRIVARGYGEAYPVAPNNTAAGRQQNRRVEIIILHAGEKAKDYRHPA